MSISIDEVEKLMRQIEDKASTIFKAMEERTREIERRGREFHRHVRNLHLKCIECGEDIYLSPFGYWDTGGNEVKIACPHCKRKMQ